MKNLVVLDGKTLGNIDYDMLKEFGECVVYDMTDKVDVAERIKDANVVLTNKVVLNEDNLKEAKNLELICEMATGFNNIDIEYAKKNNIAVTNVAGYSTNTVVQHTFASLLHLYNKISFYDNFVKSGEYSKSGMFTNLDRPYNDLMGKTWGIIGLGAIGRGVAKVCEAFGVNVIYYSTSGRNSSSDYRRVDLEELLKESDIISIHAPLNDNTKGLINYENLCKMKKEAILVNMGRGPIVVDKDLAKAIDEEKISGAALDVFSVEPIQGDNPLLSVKNKDRLVLTPHIAWASAEARNRLFNDLLENIRAYNRGEKRNRVDC
ncbi:D-2-hydroxyacid dehydrogenase [Clostridium sardiniense]|uniref:D-2-hydroxyacid dehydrogenase n=1 Tax=Clostridium sardiniense TaxID=29369 RepID=A0ABS7KZ42_CLOSR|nr:D-2-hydroxyacid dehydrogenase [Clostridium sardiniense]MBY0756083.1 D-2-hydroxyacid dehydrogenase [Clostridium sardiniense]MDQ0458975.1 glycerate dehydrogenase [Clostridium sardiniense]